MLRIVRVECSYDSGRRLRCKQCKGFVCPSASPVAPKGRQGGGLGRSIPEDGTAFKEENAVGGAEPRPRFRPADRDWKRAAPRAAPKKSAADGGTRKDCAVTSFMVWRESIPTEPTNRRPEI